MSTQTFAERCKMFEQCLPDASYRDLLKELHAEMLAKLADQPAQPASEADMQVYKAIADNYHASLQPAPVQEPEWYHFVRRGEDFFVPYEGQAPANATRLYTTPQAQMLPSGFIDAVVEAAAILGAVDPDHAPKNMRWPLADELDGFVGMINAAPQAQPAQQEPVGIVKDLFTNAAWDKLDVVGSTKVYLHTPPTSTASA